jgi:peptide/nickel transport system substrate-binding protein
MPGEHRIHLVGAHGVVCESRPRRAMATQRSTGIATVMFTDVEASTETTTRLGDDAAADLFSAHHRVVLDLITAHHGRNVESTGDGFLVLFDSARGGLSCALAIQRELAGREDGIRVRIGLNAGEVLAGDDELFGAAINLTKRVMDRADGGQILVTDAVRQLVGTMPDARFRDRGRVALKGFPERQRLYEVRATEGRPRPRPVAPRRRSRRRAPIAAVLALAVASVAGAIVLARMDAEKAVAVRPNSVAIVDPETLQVSDQVPVGVRPSGLAVDAASVWVANTADNTLTQINARSRRVAGTVSPGVNLAGLGAGPSGVWVADNERASARVIDPTFRRVARSVPIPGYTAPGSARPLAVTADALWIASPSRLVRVDPRSGRTVASVLVGNDPTGVAVGAGSVWISDETDGTLTRIDPATNEVVAMIPVGQSASGVAVDSAGVWVPVPLEDRVKLIDPASDTVADAVRVAGGPAGVAAGAGAVWVTSRRSGTLTRIDPRAARVTNAARLGHSPQGVAVADGHVWVAVQPGPPQATAVAGGAADVLRVLRPEGLTNGTDPLVAFGSGEVQYATCALLFNYPDRPFPAGAQLQPEVAAAMPTVTDGGRTYAIRLRSGFRFSPPSNAPLTAEAFARALERGLHPRSQSNAAQIMSDIVGANAFTAGRATRLAGVTARGNRLKIRLTAPSVTLPARLANTYFCAVPPTTPISGAGVEEIPMAGPYYIASYLPNRHMVLRRNPNYGGARPARLREIDFDLDVTFPRAAASVDAGRADYLGAVPVDRVAALDGRYGPRSAAGRAGRQRYFSGPAGGLHFFIFNMRRPLFARARMRRAVNFALDRRALAATVPVPGPKGVPGRPTDQFKTPGTPGFRDVAIYPLGGPDVEEARRLAGRRRGHVVFYTCNFPPCVAQGRVVRRNLAAIGLDVEVKAVALDAMFLRLYRTSGWDIGYFNWFPNTSDPSDVIEQLFGGEGSSVPGFRGEAFARRTHAALRLEDAAKRADAFASLDSALARAGAAAPFATAVTTDFFSDRIGCQMHQPIYGISLGALCIRR